jgi:hypothetical protein
MDARRALVFAAACALPLLTPVAYAQSAPASSAEPKTPEAAERDEAVDGT